METNLRLIRDELKYTQENFAEKLGVAPRTYQNYESGKKTLPLNIAIEIYKEFHYSLYYIYGIKDDKFDTSFHPKFLIDIRKLFDLKNKNLVLNINGSYWNYLQKKYTIYHNETLSVEEKEQRIIELDSQYLPKEDVTFMKYHIDFENFASYLKSNGYEYPFVEDNPNEPPYEATSDEIENISKLIDSSTSDTEIK